jgi:hypothetical protein
MRPERSRHGLGVLLFADLGSRNLGIDNGILGKLGEEQWEVCAVDGAANALDDRSDGLFLAVGAVGERGERTGSDEHKEKGHEPSEHVTPPGEVHHSMT